MTLLILSDSHGRPDRIREAIDRTRPDGILFAGDGLRDLASASVEGSPLWAVRGNCDWITTPVIWGGSPLAPQEEELITVEGVRILLMHGHTYRVKGGLGAAIARAVHQHADILVFGHTHIPLELHLSPHTPGEYAVQKPLTVFNPGSLGDRDGSFGTLTVRGGVPLLGHGSL